MLTWQRNLGAEACISSEPLMAAIEAHLGYAVFAEHGELRVHGKVERRGASLFLAEVELLDAEGKSLGRRGVEARGSECSVLNEALVLVLSLAIDAQLLSFADQQPDAPESEAQAPEPEVEKVVLAEPQQQVQVVATPPEDRPSAAPRRESRLRVVRSGSSFGVVLAAGAGLGLGLMPSAAWDTSMTVGWRTASAFAIELSATFSPHGRVPTSDGRVELRAGYAELRGCGPLWRAGLLVDACVGLWNGMLHSQGQGFGVEDFSRVTPLSGATAQLRVAWEFFRRTFVRAGAGLGVPFVRDRFVAESSSGERVLLHRVDALLTLLQLELGIQLR